MRGRARPLLTAALVVATSLSTRATCAQWRASRAAIVGGAPAPDPAVVALVDATGRPHCSGVLVAPEAVLTAAHCVHRGAPLRVRAWGDGAAVDLSVRWVERHPDYDPDTFRADLALLGLDAPSDVTPALLRRAPLDGRWVGRQVRVVGFGLDGPSALAPDGVRRARTAAVEEVEASRIRHGPATCAGDSGGAVFAGDGRDELVAVVSSGPPACRDYGRATRVDAHAEWIDDVLARRAEPGSGCAARPRPTAPAASALALLAALLCAAHRRSVA